MSCTVAAAQPAQRQILGTDGKPLGSVAQQHISHPDGSTELRNHRVLNLRESGSAAKQVTETTIVLTAPDGHVRSVSRDYQAGRSKSKIESQIEGRTATVTRTIRGDTRSVTIPLPDNLVFDNGEKLLHQRNPSNPVALSFHVLDINGPAINKITLEEIATETKNNGAVRTLVRHIRRVQTDGDSYYGFATLAFGNAGELVEIAQDSFGGTFKIAPIETKPTIASRNNRPRPRSLVSQVLVKSPVRIPKAARKGQIRLTLNFPGEHLRLPETGEQRASLDQRNTIADVCADCGPGLATDRRYLDDARQPNFWLQSDHPRIRRATRSIGRLSTSDAQKMHRLTALAAKRIRTLDFAGHVSALEAFRRRTGDCTEAAVLLAAFGRSIGIPTRVASGIVYSRERYHGVSHTFMPHVWVLAYVDGKWRSFDSALGEFDSTHLAFTVSGGDPGAIAAGHRLAGLVKIEAISEVRIRS